MPRVDPEFRDLFPPLTPDERARLEASILAEGCRDPIVVWAGHDVVLDGHNRLAICEAHAIPYNTIGRALSDRAAAMAWIIGTQFGRRNLKPFQRAELALKLEPLIAARARERMLAGKPDPTQKSAEGETRQHLASLADMSHDTIGRVRYISERADEATKDRLRRGETSINAEYQRLRNPGLRLSSAAVEYYTPAECVEAARIVLGGIDLDPASCAEANETVRATTYYDAETDGLAQEWHGRVWLNPPYCGLQGPFVEKMIGEYQAGRTTAAIILVNASATETEWFAPLFDYPLCFWRSRVNFYSPSTERSSPTHGSVFAYLGPDVDQFVEVFDPLGAVLGRLRAAVPS